MHKVLKGEGLAVIAAMPIELGKGAKMCPAENVNCAESDWPLTRVTENCQVRAN